jgi:hypothetical protein
MDDCRRNKTMSLKAKAKYFVDVWIPKKGTTKRFAVEHEGKIIHGKEQDGYFVKKPALLLEDAQKEIQNLREKCANYCNLEVATIKKYEDLHSDFISQSEAWQKTIDKNKVLEGCLARIRSLTKEFPDEGYDLVDLLDKQKKWLGRLEKEMKT